jgi:hypothetical protein
MKIEKGIPVPEPRRTGVFKYPFEDMAVGDSIAPYEYSFQNINKLSAAARAFTYRKGLAWTWTAKKWLDEETGIYMVRLWRVS